MNIHIDADESRKLIKTLLERYFPEIVIDTFSYTDWNGFSIDGTVRAAVPMEVRPPPPPPTVARSVDDDGFDIPF